MVSQAQQLQLLEAVQQLMLQVMEVKVKQVVPSRRVSAVSPGCQLQLQDPRGSAASRACPLEALSSRCCRSCNRSRTNNDNVTFKPILSQFPSCAEALRALVNTIPTSLHYKALLSVQHTGVVPYRDLLNRPMFPFGVFPDGWPSSRVFNDFSNAPYSDDEDHHRSRYGCWCVRGTCHTGIS